MVSRFSQLYKIAFCIPSLVFMVFYQKRGSVPHYFIKIPPPYIPRPTVCSGFMDGLLLVHACPSHGYSGSGFHWPPATGSVTAASDSVRPVFRRPPRNQSPEEERRGVAPTPYAAVTEPKV